ncbi:MAG TPA: protein kinase, partial [Thermoanaerobaculia bacterium]|nr:protein kinase [Thermoanaerobaculia bacterium]
PGNVMVTDQGRVKVLDFGLAKLRPEVAEDPGKEAPTEPLTDAGLAIGTVPYMSPEQLQGKPVDHRSDVFSLGVVLYEMATGRRPFAGDSSAGLMSSILRDQPPSVIELEPRLPRHLGRIVRRCLEKDPRRRYQSALDVRIELEDLRREVEADQLLPSTSPRGVAHPATGARRPRAAAWAAVGLLAAAVLAYWGWQAARGEAERAAPRAASFTQLTQETGRELQPTVSPDGKFVAYTSDAAGSWDIYLLRVDGRNPINLTAGSPADDRQPAFSPDGSRIAFRSERDGGGIFLIGATGESVRRLTDFGYNPSWSPSGRELAIATESIDGYPYSRLSVSQLWVVDVESGRAQELFAGDAVQPAWSPHGQRIAFWGIMEIATGQRDLWTVRADGSDPVAVTDDLPLDWSPAWSPDGRHLVFASDRGGTLNLWRVAIDEESGEVQGPPQALSTPSQWAGEIRFSRDGGLAAFSSQDRQANVEQVAFDPDAGRVAGEPRRVTRLSLPLVDPSLSPDGERLVFRTVMPQEDLFTIRTDGSDLRRVNDDPHRDRGPSWSPDGEWIYFYSNRSGRYEIWRIRSDGSSAQQVTRREGMQLWFPVVSPEGSRLAAFNTEGTSVVDLTLPPPVADADVRSLPNPAPATAFQGNAWSSDGTLLAGVGYGGSWETVLGVLLLDVASGRFRQVGSLRRDPRFEWEGPLAWVPGEGALLLSSVGTLKHLEIDSGVVTDLLRPPAGTALGSPMLSSDGRTLYYLRRNEQADIWMITFETGAE